MNRAGKNVILGAGLTGLSAAFFLKKDYRIFEKESTPGGLCRSRHIRGFIFDYDGHLLHFKNKDILRLVRRLMGDNLNPISRNSAVSCFGGYTGYPFQANLFGLPENIVSECLLGFIDARGNGKVKAKPAANLEQWILTNFGFGVAGRFMLPYNNKFWTIPARELSCEWVDGYIPVPSLQDVFNGAFTKSKKRFGYNAQFWYPLRGGIEQLIFSLRRRIKDNIYVLHEATRIDPAGKTVTFRNGRRENFGNLISTLPLPKMLKLIPQLPTEIGAALNKLRYTSIFCLNLGVGRKNISDQHWIYFPEEKFIFFRVGFPTNFSSSVAPRAKSSLYVEVAYSKNKPLKKGNLVERVMEDLFRAGILSAQDRIEVCQKLNIKYGYIVYDRSYTRSIKAIHNYLNRHQIYSIGRYGRWKYMSMEDSILEGKAIARRLHLKQYLDCD